MSEMIRTGSAARFTPSRLGLSAVLAISIVVSACSGGDAVDPLAPGNPTFASQLTSLATPVPSAVVNGGIVTVSWPAVTGAIEYQVNSTAAAIHTPTTTATSITATVPSGTYTVKVRARQTRNNNESGFSDDVTFIVATATETPPVVTPPPANDVTPPVISGPTIIGTLGSNGWYTSDVTVNWTATDAESAVTLNGCSVSVTSNTAGTTYTCTATSAGGTSTASVTIKRDASTPAVVGALTGTMGNNNWYVSSVGISFNVSHNGPSGFETNGCAAQIITADGTFSATCVATSGAGLSSSDTEGGKKDSTTPAIGYTSHPSFYTVDQTVSIACSASDALSGIATNTCAPITGDAYTFAIGTNSFSASATDNAGNANGATTGFTVSVTAGSLCNLTRRFVSHAGIANSLCVKLTNAEASAARGNLAAKAGQLNAYVKEVQAQTGKAITSANAAILIRLAGLL